MTLTKSMTVVIPVFNSEETLEELYSRLSLVLTQCTENYTIIFVDDGSTDHSYCKMCALNALDNRVKAIKLKKNFGQQNAIMCGLHYAQGDYTVIMDDDLQNPPEEIKKLLSKIEEGNDLVYGITEQKLKIMTTFDRFLGTIMRDLLFRVLFKIPKAMKVSSFRILRKGLVEKIIQDKTTFVYISAIIFYKKYKVKVENVPVAHAQSFNGHSRYTFIKLITLYLNIFLNYSSFFSRFADRSHPQFEIFDSQM